VLSASLAAQRTYTSLGQAWFRYYNQLSFNSRTALHTEIDDRLNFKSPHQSQFFVHIHLHYQFKPWLNAAAGQNFNWTTSLENPSLTVPEIRPWQEINFYLNSQKKWEYQIRYRIDERFIHKNNQIELEEGYHFNLRHRFRIQASTILIQNPEKKQLAIRFSDELMINTGDVPRAFDQNRIYCGLELKLNDHWSIESGYLNIIQPRNDDEYFVRNIIRTTLHHRIGLY
jgi:hypothetical protein